MRYSQTIIIRLLFDSDAPDSLRGTLSLVDEKNSRPFQDEGMLLELLRETNQRAGLATIHPQAVTEPESTGGVRLPPVP